jgi:hypothetical protein
MESETLVSPRSAYATSHCHHDECWKFSPLSEKQFDWASNFIIRPHFPAPYRKHSSRPEHGQAVTEHPSSMDQYCKRWARCSSWNLKLYGCMIREETNSHTLIFACYHPTSCNSHCVAYSNSHSSDRVFPKRIRSATTRRISRHERIMWKSRNLRTMCERSMAFMIHSSAAQKDTNQKPSPYWVLHSARKLSRDGIH